MSEMASHAIAYFKDLAKPSGSLTGPQANEASVGCEAAKRVMRQAVEDLVADACGMPILTSKSCDGTPLSVKHRSQWKMPGSGRVIKSMGKQGIEALVSNQFFRAQMPSGEWVTRVLLSEPRPLTYGKSAPAICGAAFKDWVSLRELRHPGIALEHYVIDRAGYTALERLFRQWHASQPLHMLPPGVGEDVARLTELVAVTPCALHDCQNSFKWGLLQEFCDRDLMRDIYVAVESLRNSADLISRHIGEWVSLRLRAADDRGPEWRSDQQQVWLALGLESDTVELLTEVLQLHYHDGALYFYRDAEMSGDLVEMVSTCFMSFWRWVKFTASRWLTVGSSSRYLVAALLTGLPDLVSFIDKETGSSLFYLRGFERLKVKGRTEFLCATALYSRISEGVQADLLDDSRVAMVYARLWQSASEEMKWLVDLPEITWSTIGSVCGMGAGEFRDRCIGAGHVSFHFIWRRVLQPASELPWSLTRGDVGANLNILKESDCPEEPISAQLWHLLQIEHPRPQLEQAVLLLQHIGWSSVPAEQQHGSLAVLHRWHPDYEMHNLFTRALILQVARLMPKQSAEEKRVAELCRKLQRIEHSLEHVSGATGRHEFLKGLVAVAKRRKEGGDPSFETRGMREIAQHWFSRHATLWAQQSVRLQARFNQRSSVACQVKSRALLEEQEALQSEMETLVARQSAQRDVGPLTMSSAAFTERYLEQLGELVDDNAFRSRGHMASLREAALKGQLPWSNKYIKDLSKEQVWRYQEPKQPDWVDCILKDREFFDSSVLMVKGKETGLEFYKVIYSVKNPKHLALCMLEEEFLDVEEEQDRCGDGGPPLRIWKCNFAGHGSAADVGDLSMSVLWFFPAVTHDGGLRISTKFEPMPVKVFVQGEVDRETEAHDEENPTKRAKTDDKDHDEIIKEYPWLAHLDRSFGYGGAPGKKESKYFSSSSSMHSQDKEDLPEPDEEELLAAVTDLEKARAALGVDVAVLQQDFVTRVRGRRTPTADEVAGPMALQCQTRTDVGRDFCKRRGLQVTFKCSYATVDGHDNAGVLCRAWCHRMQFFLDLEQASPSGATEDIIGQLGLYQEPSELTRLVGVSLGKEGIQERVIFIRSIPLPTVF